MDWCGSNNMAGVVPGSWFIIRYLSTAQHKLWVVTERTSLHVESQITINKACSGAGLGASMSTVSSVYFASKAEVFRACPAGRRTPGGPRTHRPGKVSASSGCRRERLGRNTSGPTDPGKQWKMDEWKIQAFGCSVTSGVVLLSVVGGSICPSALSLIQHYYMYKYIPKWSFRSTN